MKGFVKLNRDILEWEWYSHPTVSRIYIHILLRANYTDKKWQGIYVKRGQLITSTKHLAYELSLSNQQIRTALKKLENSSYITCQTTNRFSLITITKYREEQNSIKNNNKQTTAYSTIKKQSKNKPLTTTKEGKEKYKNIEERKKAFEKQVFYNSQFSKKILNDFFIYWSETNSKKEKMRFEDQPFFEIQKRLKSWEKKERQWGNTSSPLSRNR